MNKIILSFALVSSVFVSCGGSTTNEAKAKDSENKIKSEVTTQTKTIELDNLPEGWKNAEIMPMEYLYVSDSVTQEGMATLSDNYARGFGAVYSYVMEKEIQMAGAPMSLWLTWDTTAYSHLRIAMPVTGAGEGSEIIKVGALESGPGFKYVHLGGYDQMIEPHMAINEWAAGANVTLGGPWEVYATGPAMEPDTAKWETEIWYPILNN